MFAIDLNCDLGESFGNYKCGMDEEIIPYISSANIACGFHASDPVVMADTVKLVRENSVSAGAHPGFPDLAGFGRRNMAAAPKEVKAMVQYQVGALKAFCTAQGITLEHVKPHGAMYNMAGRDLLLAEAICQGIYEVDPDLILLGLAGSRMLTAAEKAGLKFAKEVFADRAYEEDGSLVARSKPGAVITDEFEAIDRVVRMVKENKVRAVTGKDIDVEADSVCVHGDGAKALEFVKKIKEAFAKEQISIIPLKKTVK